jgi:glycosyltransferase involved in cell wall biosynthesis
MDAWVVKHAAVVVVPHECRILPSIAPFAFKIKVIPNSTGLFEQAPVPRQARRRGIVTILALGSLEEDRGIELLLDSARGVRGIHILAAGHVVGRGLERKLHQSPHVDFLGLLPHAMMQSIYERGDIVFMFYRPDLELNIRAVPMKLAEALAAGRSVLVNRELLVSGEVLRDGVGYVSGFNEDELRATLTKIAASEDSVEAMGACARRLYERKYGATVGVEWLRQAVNEAVGRVNMR